MKSAMKLMCLAVIVGCGAQEGATTQQPAPPAAEVAQPLPETPPPSPITIADPGPVPPEARNLTSGNAAFAADLYTRLAARTSGNLVFSPMSIRAALAMTYGGADGTTATEMATTLHFEGEPDAVHRGYGWSMRHWNETTPRPYTLAVANRLFVDSARTIVPAFEAMTAEHYLAAVQTLDIARDPEASRTTINGWVDRATAHHIREVIPQDGLDPLTALVLVNAVYFEGQWETPFDRDDTKPETFFARGRDAISVPTMSMHQYARVGHHRDGLRTLELPYRGGDYAMTILLPDARDGLPAIERQLSAVKLAHWLGTAGAEGDVDITLPRFELEPELVELRDDLIALGMPSAFDPDRASFHGLLQTEDPVWISKVLHRAMIEVDEQGTVAAAATAVAVDALLGLPPEPVTFHVDHPFLFLLRDRNTGAILFLGRVTDPSQT